MEIYQALNVKENELTFQGLRFILDKLVKRKEIAYLDNNDTNKEVFKILFRADIQKTIKRVYRGTPLSFNFYNGLINLVSNINKTEKYKQTINETVDIFRAIEISAHVQYIFIVDDDIIRKSLKESGKVKRITQKLIDERKQKAKISIEIFYKEEISVRLFIDDIKIKLDNKEFLIINNDYVPVEKLVNFMKLMHFNPIMYWFAFGQKENLHKSIYSLVDKMRELFVDIIQDSQIKI